MNYEENKKKLEENKKKFKKQFGMGWTKRQFPVKIEGGLDSIGEDGLSYVLDNDDLRMEMLKEYFEENKDFFPNDESMRNFCKEKKVAIKGCYPLEIQNGHDSEFDIDMENGNKKVARGNKFVVYNIGKGSV